MRSFRLLFCRAALVFCLMSLAAPFLYARAGGGHSYSGGSSGGSYSGGGGSGGGEAYLVYLWIRLVIQYPLVGIPMTVVILYLLAQGGVKGRNEYMGHTIRRGNAAASGLRHDEGLKKLRARDPGFDETAFLARVKRGFLKTQAAWSVQDMRPLRAFLSDGVFERFEIYLMMQKALGFRNAMDHVAVGAARILAVESDAHFDTLHVRFDAESIDYDVTLDGGKIIRNKSKRKEAFTEIWSFLRRPGAKTLAQPGLMEGACPNCGSPLEIADAAKCGSCDSWVNSGEYDWVLSEITQACEWRPLRPSGLVPGKAALEARDPALSVQFIEDRASVAFWRWQFAQWEDEAQSLSGVAAPEMKRALLAERKNGRVLYKNAAVGGVETLAFETGDDQDRAHVQVRWSASKFRIVDGKAEAEGEAVCSHVFIFGRNGGVKTDPRAGLRSTRCPGCGAPPSGRAEAACGYCATPFNDGSRDWTLVEIMPRGLWKAPAAAVPMAAPAAAPAAAASNGSGWDALMSPKDALAILVAGMVMDGEIEKRERSFAQTYARKHAIPESRIDALVASARAGSLEVPHPKNPSQAAQYMRGLIDMSLADGVISGKEEKTLLAFGERMKLAKADVHLMVNAERSRLYREAKEVLKGPS